MKQGTRTRRSIRKGVASSPSISILVSPTTRSVAQGGTATLTVTLTRLGGYSGAVTPSVSGLPAGVTGSWSDSALTGAESTTVLTLTAAADAVLVTSDAFTVTCSGSGITPVDANATVTVTVLAGTPFFSDNFETGAFGGAGIAGDTPGQVNYYASGPDGAVVVGGSLMSDTYSIRNRYVADSAGANPERKMNFDRNIGPEFALEFDWLVPTNFAMRGTGQTKFFQAWQATYGGENPGFQVGAEIWRINDTEAYFRPMGTIPTVSELYGGGRPVYGLDDFGATFPQSYGNRFISPSGPVVPGVVAQIRIAVKQATSQFATNGTYRMWVNGVLHTTYTGGLHERNVAGAFGTAYLRYMYFMGESNPGYLAQTDFHTDNIKWYDSFPSWAQDGAFMQNRPSGMTLVADTSFESPLTFGTYEGVSITNWSGNTTESATTFSTTRVASSGGNGSFAMRSRVPQASTGDGTGPTTINVYSLNSRAVYWAVRLKHESATGTYRFHSNGEKLYYPQLTGGAGNGSITEISGDRRLMALDTVGETFRSLTPANTIPTGVWCTIEIYVRINTPGTMDGIRKCWVDGVLVSDETNLSFFSGAGPVEFNLVQYDCTRGGGTDSAGVPTGGQWRDLDRFTVYKGN